MSFVEPERGSGTTTIGTFCNLINTVRVVWECNQIHQL